MGITSSNGILWPCWNDNRTGIHQSYTSRLDFINVGGSPSIGVSADTLDFGTRYLGSRDTLDLYVRNHSFPDSLVVTGISSDSAAFAPNKTSVTIAGASTQKVQIILTAAPVGPHQSTLTISSNDTSSPNVNVALRAFVVPAAPLLVSPGNGATAQPTTPTLTWQSAGASTYRVQVSANGSFTAPGRIRVFWES